MLPSVENLNLNGNSFDDEKFEEIIDSLVTVRNLKSLFINLHEEDQVDLVMRKMVNLEFLNGLPVEKEEEEEIDEDAEQAQALEVEEA